MKPLLSVRQKKNIRYTHAVSYRIYKLKSLLPRYSDKVSQYIPKNVRKLKSQIKVYTFYSADANFIFGFLAKLKLAYDTNGIHKEATLWTTPSFVSHHVAKFLKGGMEKSDST